MPDFEDKKYVSSADVHMRLSGSFLRYKNDFYYAISTPIRDAPKDTSLSLYSIQSRKKLITIDANDEDLDTASLELGYLVIDWKTALFLTRLPSRRQKQGISPDNIFFTDQTSASTYQVSEEHLFTINFKNMLYGSYQTYSDCLHTIKDTIKNQSKLIKPFDKNFALVWHDNEVKVKYNTNAIGDVELKTGVVTLQDDYNHSVFTLRLAELGVSVA